MERFDYVIVDEFNKWRSTGSDATQKDLDDDIIQLQEEDDNYHNQPPLTGCVKLMVFKVSESYSV